MMKECHSAIYIQVGLINHLDVRKKGYEKKPSTNDSGLPNKVT
ncbi:hypothetical protein HanHA300_Chr16g0627361 [Helianthus annuus]|nr:hypothetical protein HanHA300_Chr16g0627361 [Helianthus annuus]KAJ0462004.1 hypothetical protein HanHA89_Chr16g0678611 [Helianthus annuus]KAJ0642401.1 hypothetical protein HanLR1_Chr16g0637851 [Helianthus annuus]KAJ0646274.1 hypothetical protein HanOQP8_Chr16g0633271 [Helianthus annuus]